MEHKPYTAVIRGGRRPVALFWIVAPLVGMIVQPLIGHYSDRTWNRLGRRKPYFLTGALLSSFALILLPNSGGMASIIPLSGSEPDLSW